MTQTYFPGRAFVPEYLADEVQHRTQIARTLNSTMRGATNNTMLVTLAPSAASTTLLDVRISTSTAVALHPMTAHAAAELASGNMYAVPSAGQCVVYHTNSGVADRMFMASLTG